MYDKSEVSHILMCCKRLLDALDSGDSELVEIYLDHLQRVTSKRRAMNWRTAAAETPRAPIPYWPWPDIELHTDA